MQCPRVQIFVVDKLDITSVSTPSNNVDAHKMQVESLVDSSPSAVGDQKGKRNMENHSHITYLGVKENFCNDLKYSKGLAFSKNVCYGDLK